MNARRQDGTQVRLFLAISCCYFLIFLTTLSMLPDLADHHRFSSQSAGLAIVLFSALGLLFDIPAAALVRAWGLKQVILTGAGLLALGMLIVVWGETLAGYLAGAAVMGLGGAGVLGPMLGGLSQAAGERVAHTQSWHVIVQRIGAILAAFIFGIVYLSFGLEWAAGILLGAIAVLAALTLLTKLPATVGAEPERPASFLHMVTSMFTMVGVTLRESPALWKGLVLNAAVPSLLVYGASFFPMVLRAQGASETIFLALGIREVVAIIVAVGLMRIHLAVRLEWLVGLSLLIGVVGFVMIVLGNPAVSIVGFGMQGIALSVGTYGINFHTITGTHREHRYYGYACGGIVGRLANLAIPLVLSSVISESLSMVTLVTAGILLGLTVVYAIASKVVSGAARG